MTASPASAAAAERYLRLLAEAELRRDGLGDRLRAAAEGLTWAGAIDEDTADAVVDGFMTALAMRGRPPLVRQLIRPFPLSRSGRPAAPPYTGEVRVVPVGVALPGRYQRLWLLGVTLAPGEAAVVTMTGLIGVDGRPSLEQLPIGPYGPSDADLGLTFTGSTGTRYPHRMIGGGTSDGVWWRQDLILPAAVADGDRWLEVATDDRAASIRPDLRRAVGAGGSGVSVGSEDADGGWLLDGIAAARRWLDLWSPETDPDGSVGRQLVRLDAMTDAIRAVGLAPARPTALPVVESGGPDGREATFPAVAVLPRLEGVQFAVTGLVSAAKSATLRVLAWSWAPGQGHRLASVMFSWWARDDLGRWHVGRPYATDLGQPVMGVDIVLVPPLDPAVSALEVMVTGRGGTVHTIVPLTPALE